MSKVLRILGIESSCDETAAAVVEIDDSLRCTLLSHVVASSVDLHAQYGGVVPEIAARSHIESIVPVIEQAVREAADGGSEQKAEEEEGRTIPSAPDSSPSPDPWDQIDGIAVTHGAGLGGSLLVGVMTARTLAIAKNKPLYGVNHVEGHIYANFITKADSSLLSAHSFLPSAQPKFPMLGLIVSGGHSQLVLWQDHFEYTLLGQTQDDAVGEAFDKVAKIIGLPYPGGPSVGKKALEGDPHAFDLPKARMTSISPALQALRLKYHRSDIKDTKNHGYDFSFSGLKTAVLRRAQELIGQDFTFPSKDLPERLSEAQKANIAAVFQRVAIETVVDKAVAAYEEFQPASVVIGGGVAASPELRRQLTERLPLPIEYQDAQLMTDNGAMIATLGCFKAILNQPHADPYSLEIVPNLSM